MSPVPGSIGLVAACALSISLAVLWTQAVYSAELYDAWIWPFFGATVGVLFRRMARTDTRGERRMGDGVLAAVIVVGFVIAQLVLTPDPASHFSALDADEAIVSSLAFEVAHEKINAGESLEWPAGISIDQAVSAQEFPPQVWEEASRRWQKLSLPEQDELRRQRRKFLEEHHDIRGTPAGIGFLSLLWGALAIGVSFVLGSRIIAA